MIKELNLKIAGAELNIVTDDTSDINLLIGKSFKRNKYGLSLWTDTIKFVGCKFKIVNRNTKEVIIYIVGEKSTSHFTLDEIVIINETPNFTDEGYKKFSLNENFKEMLKNASFKKKIDDIKSTNNNK